MSHTVDPIFFVADWHHPGVRVSEVSATTSGTRLQHMGISPAVDSGLWVKSAFFVARIIETQATDWIICLSHCLGFVLLYSAMCGNSTGA